MPGKVDSARIVPLSRTGGRLLYGPSTWDVAACSIVFLFVLALALTPHLRLTREVGQVTFFQMGFDEDTYLVYMLSKYFFLGRAFSHYAFTSLFILTGHSVDWTMILADAIFPGATVIAAYYLASQVVYSWQGRTLLTLVLIFGQDLFSLANVSVWSHRAWLSDFKKLFGSLGSSLVPDATTSYLTILRTPEPQLSYAVVFLLLALLLKMAKSEGGTSTANIVVAACLSLLLPVTYTHIAFPTLLATVWIALVTLVCGPRDVALRLLAIALVACVVFASITIAAGGGLPTFSSHFPVVTPALLLCAGLAVPLTIWIGLRSPTDRTAWLAVGFLLIPLAVSNQQIITGVMISARDWERYINYQLLALGVALISTRVPRQSVWLIRSFQWSAICVALVIAFVIVEANDVAIGYWRSSNNPAILQVLEAARKRYPDVNKVFVQEGPTAQLLALRTGNKLNLVPDITKIGNPPMGLIPVGGVPPRSPHESYLFEFWWRTGTSPEEVERTLMFEAQRWGGFFSSFLYDFTDLYAATTDARYGHPEEVIRDIPRVIQRYKRYLESNHAAAKGTSVLVLTEKEPSLFNPPKLRTQLVATSDIGGKTVYAYLQQGLD